MGGTRAQALKKGGRIFQGMEEGEKGRSLERAGLRRRTAELGLKWGLGLRSGVRGGGGTVRGDRASRASLHLPSLPHSLS